MVNKTENDALSLNDFKTLVVSQIHTRYTRDEAKKIFNELQDGSGLL